MGGFYRGWGGWQRKSLGLHFLPFRTIPTPRPPPTSFHTDCRRRFFRLQSRTASLNNYLSASHKTCLIRYKSPPPHPHTPTLTAPPTDLLYCFEMHFYTKCSVCFDSISVCIVSAVIPLSRFIGISLSSAVPSRGFLTFCSGKHHFQMHLMVTFAAGASQRNNSLSSHLALKLTSDDARC